MGRKLYVGNLPYSASEQDLQDLFFSAVEQAPALSVFGEHAPVIFGLIEEGA